MGPYYRQEPDTLADVFYVPTDPSRLYLDDFGDGFWEEQFEDGIYTGEEPKAFRVEKSSGIPVVAVEAGEDGASVAVSSVEELLEEIERVKMQMENAHYNFQNAMDPDLIDCYIFESNAAWKKYRFLLRQAKML